jgi:hypothetical protein
MNVAAFIGKYAAWHYSVAFSDGARVGLNFTWFFWRVFSVPELVLNLFTPFERLEEKPRLVGTFEQTGGALIVNVLMRVLGALFRLPIILLGAFCSAASVLVTVLFYLLWAFLPVLIPAALLFGILVFFGKDWIIWNFLASVGIPL